MRKSLIAPIALLITVAAAGLAAPSIVAGERHHASRVAEGPARSERIETYRPRFGRSRPVVAIVGENSGTELTDYVIPFGILARAGVAEVVTVGTRPGLLTMRPALHVRPDMSAADFDRRFPDGADYVIVPAFVKPDDPVLLRWIASQGKRGGTVVSICDGALVVANAGLLKGHRATAPWATRDHRRETYPDVRWVENSRYVADGRIVSSAGISAAIPTSLALVEAIGGHAKAAEVARQVATPDWSATHNSEFFHPKLGRNLSRFAATYLLNPWFHKTEAIGVPIANGVDEIGLALTADAYTRTGRSTAYSLASSRAPVITRRGMIVVPDGKTGSMPVDRMIPVQESGSRPALDVVLASIAQDYGRTTAVGVALEFEYGAFPQQLD